MKMILEAVTVDSVKILNLLELLKNKEILAVPVEVAI